MINPMDFIRVIYNKFMIFTGLADTYRNEQFLAKPDILYDYERLVLKSNLNSINRDLVSDKMKYLIMYFTIRVFCSFSDYKIIN